MEVNQDYCLLYENGKYQYGKVNIEDRNSHVNGTDIRSFGEEGVIEENLLQEDLIVPFKSNKEKEQILNIIPSGFYATVWKSEIKIEFDKEDITAPVYINNYSNGGYFRRAESHYSYKKEDSRTIKATLKSPELTQKILDFKGEIYKIKSQIYPNQYNDKYDASINPRMYLIWLVQTGQAEILGGRNDIYTYNPFSKKGSRDTSKLTPKECLKGLQDKRSC